MFLKASTLSFLVALITWSCHQRVGDTERYSQSHGADSKRAHGADMSGLECFHKDAKGTFDRY